MNVLEAEADKFRIIRVPKDDYVELKEKIKVNVCEPLDVGGADSTIGIDLKKTDTKIFGSKVETTFLGSTDKLSSCA